MRSKNLALAPAKHLNKLMSNDIKRDISCANVIMMEAVNSIKTGAYPEFSSILSDQTAQICYTALVADRIINKFSYGEDGNDTKAAAFSTYVNYEETHCKHIAESYEFWGPSKAHLDVRLASAKLRQWFCNFEFDLRECMIEFSPGETYVSTKGMTSIASKLSDLRHWTTTYNALHLTCMLIYNNAGLKRMAREHIGFVSRSERRDLYARFSKSDNTGFEVFSWLIKDRVLTIVSGARASSVPKNTLTDRFINVEPMFSMILQRVIAGVFRGVLARVGNDLSNHRWSGLSAQSFHGRLISLGHLATVDFKNASDSVISVAVDQVFPRSVSDALTSTRSHFVDFGDFEVQPYKLSSMGNGFTFEVMTTLLYAISSVTSPFSRVYGDDVILPNNRVKRFTSACGLIGFHMNMKKSFIRSRFRESCGFFYHEDCGYLRSFDFGEIKSMSDIMTTCNKLYMILNNEHSHLIDPELVNILDRTRSDILLLIPVLQKGHVPLTSDMQLQNLSLYAFDASAVQKHKKNSTARRLWSDAVDTVDDRSIRNEVTTSVVVLVPRWRPTRQKNISRRVLFLCALFSGRAVAPTIKGQGEWILIPHFITETGRMLQINSDGASIDATYNSRRQLDAFRPGAVI